MRHMTVAGSPDSTFGAIPCVSLLLDIFLPAHDTPCRALVYALVRMPPVSGRGWNLTRCGVVVSCRLCVGLRRSGGRRLDYDCWTAPIHCSRQDGYSEASEDRHDSHDRGG